MKNIPFFQNLPDGTHCYQAALKMVLTFLSPKEDWSFEKLDMLSGKLAGKWTWPTTSLLWLKDQGYEVKLIEEFSYEEFAKKGREYLVQKYGEEVAKAQDENSNLKTEQKLALQFAQKCQTEPCTVRCMAEERIPNWKDLKRLFKDSYLIICNINACQLYNQKGYSGHFVVPTEITSSHIRIHDPGLPPAPSIKVAKALFERAWGYPDSHAKNILAIRK